ncbi:MAG TPA: hypothetical protein VM432_08540 [Bdellovibrionales bacterium]|nr:hypothetical protein [Bdellovibrionales bacterium]
MRIITLLFLFIFPISSFAAVDCKSLTEKDALTPPFRPSAEELGNRLAKLNADLEAHFPKYLEDNYANCTMKRSELRILLLDTKNDRKTRDAVLKSIVTKEKFPTLISALADAKVLVHGLEKKIWKGPAGSLEKAQALLQTIKADLAEENRVYGEPWNRMTEELKKRTDMAAQSKFLRESPDFKKLRAHLLTEPADSSKLLAEIQSVAKTLK